LKIYREGKWLIKRYHLSNLRCEREKIAERCTLMCEMSLKITSIPGITHEFLKHDELIIRQYFIEKDNSFHPDGYLSLAKDLDLMHDSGLIHGDIHKRNLITKKMLFD